jgi:hypothetical protein
VKYKLLIYELLLQTCLSLLSSKLKANLLCLTPDTQSTLSAWRSGKFTGTDISHTKVQILHKINSHWNMSDMKITVFWDLTPYILVDIYLCFGGTCCLHILLCYPEDGGCGFTLWCCQCLYYTAMNGENWKGFRSSCGLTEMLTRISSVVGNPQSGQSVSWRRFKPSPSYIHQPY